MALKNKARSFSWPHNHMILVRQVLSVFYRCREEAQCIQDDIARENIQASACLTSKGMFWSLILGACSFIQISKTSLMCLRNDKKLIKVLPGWMNCMTDGYYIASSSNVQVRASQRNKTWVSYCMEIPDGDQRKWCYFRIWTTP